MTHTDHPDQVDLDARRLRALAHPLRLRLLGLLRSDGPSTATKLGERTDLNSGATSYHLRQLAEAGLIVDDPDHSDGRERWWKAAHRFSRFDDRSLSADEAPLGEAYLQVVAQTYGDRLRTAAAVDATLPPDWKQAGTMSDLLLDLTVGETARLRDELMALLGRYRSASAGRPGPVGTRRVAALVAVMPEGRPEDPEPVTSSGGDPP